MGLRNSAGTVHASVWKYDGKQWKEIYAPKGLPRLSGVWALSSKLVYAVGLNGTILHYNGSKWAQQPSGTTKSIRTVWGTSGTNVYAGGSSGILHYEGKTWKKQWLPVQKGIDDVWGTSPTNVYAVGSAGVFHFDGKTWKHLNQTKNINGVGSDGKGGIIVVGSTGVALQYNGKTWKALNTGTKNSFYAIWGAGSKVFAVGQHGTILEYLGQPKP